MAISPKCLVQPVLLTGSAVNYYAPSKGITIIDKMTVVNTTATYDAITIYLVPSGVTLSTTHKIIIAYSIAPFETFELSTVEGHVLNTGDSIQAFATTASALSFRVSGREVLV